MMKAIQTQPYVYSGILAMLILSFASFSCSRPSGNAAEVPPPTQNEPEAPAEQEKPDAKQIVFAAGCFWCVEAVFEQLEGVSDVVSGYAGGTASTANYQLVSSGATDHAEAVRITYDPAVISYGKLLQIFFTAHDPTQLNRQGPDVGRHYRSAIFYADDQEKQLAEAYIQQLEDAGTFDAPIVTTLEPLSGFYVAEEYHQNYADQNPGNPYIRAQAAPKVNKVQQKFPDALKKE